VQRFIKHKIQKMAITVNNDTSLHEAAHCFVAYIASDFFETEFVTADSIIAKTQDLTSLGGIKGKLTKDGESLKTLEHDLIVLISLAGMAADDINHSNGVIYDGLYDNKLFVNKLKSVKYSGDFDAMYPSLQRLDSRLVVNQREYTISCQKLLHNLFNAEPTKSILFGLRDLIENAPNKTVSGAEIHSYLDENGLMEWKLNNWDVISNNRLMMFKSSATNSSLLISWRKWWQKLFSS